MEIGNLMAFWRDREASAEMPPGDSSRHRLVRIPLYDWCEIWLGVIEFEGKDCLHLAFMLKEREEWLPARDGVCLDNASLIGLKALIDSLVAAEGEIEDREGEDEPV